MKFSALPLIAAAALFTAASAAPATFQEVTTKRPGNPGPPPGAIRDSPGQPEESHAQDAEPMTTTKYGTAETQGMHDRCIWKNGNWHCPFIGQETR
ncbi:hypothetical protein MY11210_003774 [Beauveria gryllotalpidicola]